MSRTAIGSETAPEVVYRSEVRVEPQPGGVKMVYLPCEADPIPMGLHGAIAGHYKVAEGAFTPHAATLDYLVGSTAACLTGTLSRALQVRKIPTDGGRLEASATGEIEIEDGVLVVRRIRMCIKLRADSSQRETAERAVAVYAPHCPMYRSLCKAIEITTEMDFQAD